MNRIRKVKGFTLIELIVVIIIIGILAAIAAVAYNQFIGNANTGSAQAKAKAYAETIQATSVANNLSPASAATTLRAFASPALPAAPAGVSTAVAGSVVEVKGTSGGVDVCYTLQNTVGSEPVAAACA